MKLTTTLIGLLILALSALSGGCASQAGATTQQSPMQQWTTANDLFVGASTALTGIESSPHPFPPATAQKIDADRAPVAKTLEATYQDILNGASTATVTGDLALLQSVLGVFTTDQYTFANPFPVQTTTQPTVTP
jgi:hypothetical protein